jgi:hypothetical protein
MRNWNRYLNGALFGMVGEYLYRVEVSLFPIVLIILIGLLIILIGLLIIFDLLFLDK